MLNSGDLFSTKYFPEELKKAKNKYRECWTGYSESLTQKKRLSIVLLHGQDVTVTPITKKNQNLQLILKQKCLV